MFRKILFCTDFSEDAHWAFTYAFQLAKTFKSKLETNSNLKSQNFFFEKFVFTTLVVRI